MSAGSTVDAHAYIAPDVRLVASAILYLGSSRQEISPFALVTTHATAPLNCECLSSWHPNDKYPYQ